MRKKKITIRPGQLICSAEATPATKQHNRPCGDCPWRRDALPGWLGNMTATDWLKAAHGETRIECHTKTGAECAGAAIYRANMYKRTRTPTLQLPVDRTAVFATPMEFVAHHESD